MGGGCVAPVYRVDLADGKTVVAKLGDATLVIEAAMLRALAATGTVPVPGVLHVGEGLLVLEHIETRGSLDARAERHAAELLAALHAHGADAFGYDWDTLIGPLPQPNPWTSSWRAFFRDHRLLAMARTAFEAGQLPAESLARAERLAGRLDRYVADDARPALIHGDLWGGNVLVRDGRIAALIDPAIYYADPEIELAYATLFNTFGTPFFDRYGEIRPLRPGFFEVRRELYTLYHLLVHVHLFGGHYVGAVDRILQRYAG
jgi:fructosamine-3-kinase